MAKKVLFLMLIKIKCFNELTRSVCVRERERLERNYKLYIIIASVSAMQCDIKIAMQHSVMLHCNMLQKKLFITRKATVHYFRSYPKMKSMSSFTPLSCSKSV